MILKMIRLIQDVDQSTIMLLHARIVLYPVMNMR